MPTRVGPVPVRVIGDGPPVIAVHGLLVDGRLWDGMTAQLAPHASVILPDLPLGCQRSAVPDRSALTPERIAGAVVDVLDGLGLDSAVLVGNDTGGALSQIVASAHPDRFDGLVLAGVDAFEHFPPPLIRPFVALAAVPGGMHLAVRAFGIPALLADPGRLNLLSTRGFGRHLVRDLLAPARADREIRADLTAFVRQIRPEPLLAAVLGLEAFRDRARVLWGRRDRVFPHRDAERLADLLGTSVIWLDDAATFVPVDRPDAVADAVRSLLGDLAATSGDVGTAR
ncbi:MAG: alpha/beta fold hydrolase [Dermatophilaceae bacterium]